MRSRFKVGSPLQAISLGLSVAILWLLFILVAAAAGPAIYWHAASTGLPSDVEALAAAPTTLYAGTWGGGG